MCYKDALFDPSSSMYTIFAVLKSIIFVWLDYKLYAHSSEIEERSTMTVNVLRIIVRVSILCLKVSL